MTRFWTLFAILGWLVVGHAHEQLPQHVLTNEPVAEKPHPQAALIVREKYILPRFEHELRDKQLTQKIG